MCPYMDVSKAVPICEPRKDICTMCVCGNRKEYKEIKAKEGKNSGNDK